MYNTPDQGPENHLGEDNERLFQKKKAAASAPTPKKPSTDQTQAGNPSRVYTAKPSVQKTPAYANRRNIGQESSKKAGNTTDPSTAPTMKISTGSNVPKTAPSNKQIREASAPISQKVVPPSISANTAPPKGETPAYAGRRAAENAGTPSPSQPHPTAAAKDKKAGLSRLGADMMANSVKAITYIVLVLVVSVFLSIFIIRVGNDIFAFVKSEETVDITIPEDATTQDIATILYDNGIISYPNIFQLYCSIKNESGEFLAGDYTVSPSMSYDELRNAFKPQAAEGTSWITIPEGYTTDEIIDLMVSYGIGDRETYVDVINNYDFDYWFVDELEESGIPEGRYYRLDGYLFPDTYEFYNSSSEVTVIDKLLARFDQVFVDDYRSRAAELGYSVDDILSIASLIEKEAGTADDYRRVSSVFHNRLNNPSNYPKLQSDATVVYALQIMTGERPTTVTSEQLETTDNPYNTYLYDGLPPGPISNPSASAIRYALYPMDSNYYYFISANNGTTLFAATLVEHQQNIQRVLQMNEQQAGES
ncbi:MAG: endolytic transglycosylase MltG [Clostridiales bacterium]|nr:endolytic transglycosylase MltG [Clostridiales bacterium]